MKIFSSCSTCCNAGNKRCYHRNLQIAVVVQSLSFIFLWTHGLQYARLPCPSPSPRVAQTHVHWVSDAIQLSESMLPLSPPALNLSQNQGHFQWVGSSHQVAKVLELLLQIQSLQWIFRIQGWFPLELTGLISLLSKELSRAFSSTTDWKHQFFSAQPSLWSNSHIHAWLPEMS